MTINEFINKIRRRWMRLRLQPIRVFCLHHVCERFDAESMYPCDWMAIDEFKQKINDLRGQGFQFISLSEAHQHLKNDWFRKRKYAVLTFDDGYKSLLEVLPWLEEQQIPATLFINGKYLDGVSYRDTDNEQYLTYEELFALNSSLIEIGHHGWEHISASQITKEEFTLSLKKNVETISSHPRYIPFWAYTWGVNTEITNVALADNDLIPVLVNGNMNYFYKEYINRELFD